MKACNTIYMLICTYLTTFLNVILYFQVEKKIDEAPTITLANFVVGQHEMTLKWK